jgi:hypothetical protein
MKMENRLKNRKISPRLIETPEDIEKSVPYHYVAAARQNCTAAASHEMKLNGASVLWAKIKRAETILEEALALEDQPS